MPISMDKKYTTRDGRAVRLLCTDAPGGHPVVALIAGVGGAQVFTATGGFYVSQANEFDLIEAVPFVDFKIDDPVMVRDYSNQIWQSAYFAGVNPLGFATTWFDGATSWTSRTRAQPPAWTECRRPTAEELAK